MKFKEYIRLMTPPIFSKSSALVADKPIEEPPSVNDLYLSGDYRSWAVARAECIGYDSSVILEKTKQALLQVKNGGAVYERDSVLFDEIEYAWPLLAGLMAIAAQNAGRLNVIDFGGSLGSTYYQNRHFLKNLQSVRWNIIEQPCHVAVGRELFEDEQLRFYSSIQECLAETQPQVFLFSSVLQYLEHSAHILTTLLQFPCEYLIIDRTPFWIGNEDRLCIQHVPADIYETSYPCWILSEKKLSNMLESSWEILAQFDSLDRFASPVTTKWRGLIAKRRDNTEDRKS